LVIGKVFARLGSAVRQHRNDRFVEQLRKMLEAAIGATFSGNTPELVNHYLPIIFPSALAIGNF
jgi:hypothetical protein